MVAKKRGDILGTWWGRKRKFQYASITFYNTNKFISLGKINESLQERTGNLHLHWDSHTQIEQSCPLQMRKELVWVDTVQERRQSSLQILIKIRQCLCIWVGPYDEVL